MSQQPFQYEAPQSLAELWSTLDLGQDGTRFLAGGTDLLVKYKRKQLSVTRLVDIKNIPDLQGVWLDAALGLRIGALTTLTDLAAHPLVNEHVPVLAAAASKMASAQVRNRATVGGNLCNAAPSADLAPPLLVLQARIKTLSAAGERELPLRHFFAGPGLSTLRPGELVSEVILPLPEGNTRAVYLKQGLRQAMDIAMVGVAVKLKLSGSLCEEAAIALGAVSPVPLRAESAEQYLKGRKLDAQSIAEGADLAAKEASPISDVRASALYRSQLVAALLKQGLQQCAGILTEGEN